MFLWRGLTPNTILTALKAVKPAPVQSQKSAQEPLAAGPKAPAAGA